MDAAQAANDTVRLLEEAEKRWQVGLLSSKAEHVSEMQRLLVEAEAAVAEERGAADVLRAELADAREELKAASLKNIESAQEAANSRREANIAQSKARGPAPACASLEP